MKKRYLVIGLLAAAGTVFSQSKESNYEKRPLKYTEVEMVFSYYTQDNDHSAVTGGTGTEDLQVYATDLSYNYVKDSVHTIHFDIGLDVITSASTDNIDFIKSSASRFEFRPHFNLGYSKPLRNKRTTIGTNFSFSIESDYLSLGQSLSFINVNPSKSRELSATIEAFFDDLRWGRYQGRDVLKLVYPVELRNVEWFDIFRRNSYNLSLGWYQTINPRMGIGFYPGFTYQSGLLSTPFHRVFFAENNIKKVENLPTTRVKVPLGVQLNTFVGTRWIIRSYYRYYWDDFGIEAHTVNLEGAWKLNRVLTLTPFVRLYDQTGSDYFKPFKEHSIVQQFYTSDYDLSDFQSIKAGMGFRYAPFSYAKGRTFKAMELRYANYRRSDGMVASIITLYLSYDKQRPRLERLE